ncbi:MAG: inorganic phosphate transporter, partial [Chloroflexota bacterium]
MTLLLIVVLALAVIFDYINGFHDTANAVATVVSTTVLPGRTAVLLAAVFNFVGAFAGVGV